MFQKLRELSKNLAIYGLGDVGISIVNFLLLPLYVDYLTKEDYGVLGLLGSVEVIAKIVFRLGLDGSFMRFFYDARDERDRQTLASTLFFFLLAVNGLLLVLSLVAAPAIGSWIFGGAANTRALQLVLLNTFIIAFTFFPFHVLRIENRAVEFSVLALARSAATVVLRVLLIVGAGMGVMGVVVADLAVTAALMAMLVRWFAPLIRPLFSRRLLRESLAFGLPRLPHAAAQQVIAVADKFILSLFRPVADVGLYSMGVSFGLTQKLFLSAFEYAWAPFYYATAKEPDAKTVFRTVTTYGIVVLTAMTAVLSAAARDLLDLMTRGLFVDAAPVVAWTALGVLFQGVYLLTSIGLNLTKNTRYYPASTMTAAAVNVGLNFTLVPTFGLLGAAWANGVAYAVQAALAFWFSQRFYPVDHEYGRIARVAVAGSLAFMLGRSLPATAPLAGIVLRSLVVLIVFAGLLWITGFFRPEEMKLLRGLQVRRPAAAPPPTPAEAVELGGEIVAVDEGSAPVLSGKRDAPL